jgi:hypothetical protein
MPKLDLDKHELRDFSKTAALLDRGYNEMQALLAAELVPTQRSSV